MSEKSILIEEELYNRITETPATENMLKYAIASTVVLSSWQRVQRGGTGKVFYAGSLKEVFEKKGTLRNLLKLATVIDLLNKIYVKQPTRTAEDDADDSDDGDDKESYRIRKVANPKATLSTDSTDLTADMAIAFAMAGGYVPVEAKQVRLDNPDENQVQKANLGIIAMGFEALNNGNAAKDVRIVHNLDGWTAVEEEV